MRQRGRNQENVHQSLGSSLRMKRLLGLLLLIVLTFASAYAKNSGADNRSKDENHLYHLYDDINMVSTLKISYKKPRIVVHAVYPQLKVEDEEDHPGVSAFNSQVLDLIQEEIDHFKNQAQQKTQLYASIPKDKNKNDLFIDYDTSFINTSNDHIASIRFSIQGLIDGEPSAYRFHRVLNYNLEDNQKIELSELFDPGADYLTVFSDYAQEVLAKRLGDKATLAYSLGPSEENFQNWNIKANGILLTFDQQAGIANEYGTQTILVPFSMLKGMIDKDSPIASCIFKKRCSRNNILTGGFIDEASNQSMTNSLNSRLYPFFS